MPKRKAKKKPAQGRSGQIPEGDKRVSANIRADLHKKLRIAAIERETTVGELIEELIEKHL